MDRQRTIFHDTRPRESWLDQATTVHHGDRHGLAEARQCCRLIRTRNHGRSLCRLGWFALWLRHWVSTFGSNLLAARRRGTNSTLLTRSINGILAMKAFIRDFNTGYTKPDTGTVNLSPAEISTVVAILSAGTFVGALISAPFGDWLGRRHSIIYATGVFCLGVVLQICAAALPMMIAGRYVVPHYCPLLQPRVTNAIAAKLFCRRGRWLDLGACPVISIRNGPKVDTRHFGLRIPAVDYRRSSGCINSEPTHF